MALLPHVNNDGYKNFEVNFEMHFNLIQKEDHPVCGDVIELQENNLCLPFCTVILCFLNSYIS